MVSKMSAKGLALAARSTALSGGKRGLAASSARAPTSVGLQHACQGAIISGGGLPSLTRASLSSSSLLPSPSVMMMSRRTLSSSARRQGVEVQSLSPGNGKDFPKAGDTVSMHYTGTLLNGNKFDSSVDRGQPFETRIGVGQVIKGWDEGVPQLSLGEKAILTCSPDYAYGARGFPPVIPANSTLKFEVQLLAINGRKA